MTDWNAIEDAVQAWVRAAGGLSEAQVIWADQSGVMPDRPFVAVRLGDLAPVGMDATQTLVDLTRPAGTEVELRSRGTREMTVNVQAFTEPTMGGASARAILTAVQLGLNNPDTSGALNDAGLSAFDTGRVTNISALAGTDWEGRANLDVRFYVVLTSSAFVGFIDRVESASDFTDG